MQNMFIQLINLDKSKDRLKKCENIFHKNKIDVSNIRLSGTYGLKDVKIIKLDKNNKKTTEIDIGKFYKKQIQLKENVIYEIFDKREPNFKILYKFEPNKMIIKKKKRQRNLTIGEIGCMLSHFRAINNIAKGKYAYGLIFEDDLQLANNFKEKLEHLIAKAPKKWDILKLDGTSVRDLFKGNSHKSSFFFSTLRYGFNKYFYNAKAELLHGVSGATGYLITKSCAKNIINILKHNTINGLEGATDIFLYITLPKRYKFRNIWHIKQPIVWQRGEKSNITAMGR